MSSLRVIVFGPTGGVGGAAALQAYRKSAHVTLAMRNVAKPLATLPDLPRIQADLTDTASISEAVKKSGATRAFLYTTNDMAPTFAALRDSGIDHVVLLSSWTIYPDDVEKAVVTSHAIPAKHAKAELALIKSGLKYSAVRPMYFASNLLFEKASIERGEVKVLNPNGKWDYITQEDIGAVCGGLLAASSPPIGEVPIMGPEMVSQRSAWEMVGHELGREIKVKEVSYDEFLGARDPENPFARSLAIGTIRTDEEKYPEERRRIALENMRRFAGREPMSLAEWLKLHRNDFGV